MIELSKYINEQLIFELKSQTYLDAAKKAKKLGDPRAEKFLQAFKDNIDKELMNVEDPDDEEKKFNIFYNADKKSIVRLKGLAKNKRGGAFLRDLSRGTALEIQNDDLQFTANVYVASNEDGDRQIFLRQSIISEGNWKKISNKFSRIAEKINDSEAKKPFTFVEVFTNTSRVEFFYIIDTDNFIPVYLMQEEGGRHNDDCLDYLSEDDKSAINAICKAMNPNHKDL